VFFALIRILLLKCPLIKGLDVEKSLVHFSTRSDRLTHRSPQCDGRRPQCSACEADNRAEPCVYETRGNQSRSEALKERNQELEAELNRLRQRLDPSKTGSPPDAASASALSTPNEDVRFCNSHSQAVLRDSICKCCGKSYTMSLRPLLTNIAFSSVADTLTSLGLQPQALPHEL